MNDTTHRDTAPRPARLETTAPAPGTSSRRRGALHLGSIAGVDVHADWSLIIIVLLISVSLGAGVFPAWHPDWSGAVIWATAIAAALLFIASVLVHELSHALVGRAQGVPIPRITLFVFGGMAELEREPDAWRAELLMAIVGPITSFVLGVAMIFAGNLLAGRVEMGGDDPLEALRSLGPAATVLLWLGPINLLLAAFNLVPGFPLDGGRVLRAAIWGATGDLVRATRYAAGAGRVFGTLLILVGFAMLFGWRFPVLGGGAFAGLWLALIGWFLASAARQSYAQLLARHSLTGIRVSSLMIAPVATVPPTLSVASLIDDYIMRSDQRAFPVLDGERLAGLVTLEDARRVERAARERQTVASIMTPAARLATVGPSAEVMDALQLLARNDVNQLPVVENGELRGLLRREDLLKWLSLHGGSREAAL